MANGLAFEFASRSGPAGLFDVRSPSDPPFLTDGTGHVANLNADKVDGLDAAQLQGQQGPPGTPGPQGPPGPTASASDAAIPRANLAVTGAAVRPAGTYAVSLLCLRQAGSAAVFDEGALTVVAAAV